MGFTSNCVIHKSNPSIWRRLMNYGIHPDACSQKMTARNKDNRICTLVDQDTMICVREEDLTDKTYDCEENEDLFFALATLRDDSDINQWFIYDNRAWNDENPQRCWFICKMDSIEDDMCYDQMYSDCEKATIQEIIAHFNGLDDDPEVENLI